MNVTEGTLDEIQRLGIVLASNRGFTVRTPVYGNVYFYFQFGKWACHASSDVPVQYGSTPTRAYQRYITAKYDLAKAQLEAFSIEQARVSSGPTLLEVTDWIEEEHCAVRCIKGTDYSRVENRVAFIETTPRVRILPYSEEPADGLNWQYGPKGTGYPEYGKCEEARLWCDNLLRKLGYQMEKNDGNLQ